MKSKYWLIGLLLIFVATVFCGCYELTPNDDDYFTYFEDDTLSYSFDVSSIDVKSYSMALSTYTENDDAEKFSVDDKDGYESKAYKYMTLKVKKACTVDQISMYIKWDKAGSGSKAASTLGVQFFKVPKGTELFTAGWIKDALTAMAKGQATGENLFKDTIDENIALKENSWNDGCLIDLKNFQMDVGDTFVIKFVENTDFIAKDKEPEGGGESGGSEGGTGDKEYTFTEKSDNDISFKLDKLMFHIA